ncbi:hypothetical protein ANN_10105 [Periplaneta americana]|uniref:Uncharacterized protein n=1 Tax=Periplaneta americana TaxID=6978 RepID=A0ABQ8TN43_PERAM|nr:hypothetical protein ANN_10105 [Periplaneta americana]
MLLSPTDKLLEKGVKSDNFNISDIHVTKRTFLDFFKITPDAGQRHKKEDIEKRNEKIKKNRKITGKRSEQEKYKKQEKVKKNKVKRRKIQGEQGVYKEKKKGDQEKQGEAKENKMKPKTTKRIRQKEKKSGTRFRENMNSGQNLKLHINKLLSKLERKPGRTCHLRQSPENNDKEDKKAENNRNSEGMKEEKEKNWLGHWIEKKLPSEGCTGRNGERKKSSEQKKIQIDDIKNNHVSGYEVHETYYARLDLMRSENIFEELKTEPILEYIDKLLENWRYHGEKMHTGAPSLTPKRATPIKAVDMLAVGRRVSLSACFPSLSGGLLTCHIYPPASQLLNSIRLRATAT